MAIAADIIMVSVLEVDATMGGVIGIIVGGDGTASGVIATGTVVDDAETIEW